VELKFYWPHFRRKRQVELKSYWPFLWRKRKWS